MDNLPMLRDIHLPPEVSAFPPGYGWGVMAAVVVLSFLAVRLYKYLRLKSRKYYALKLLKDAQNNNLTDARRISELLRRICLLKYPEAATLFGQKWVDFLNQHSRKPLSQNAVPLLVYAPYIPHDKQYAAQDYQALRKFVAAWIGENL